MFYNNSAINLSTIPRPPSTGPSNYCRDSSTYNSYHNFYKIQSPAVSSTCSPMPQSTLQRANASSQGFLINSPSQFFHNNGNTNSFLMLNNNNNLRENEKLTTKMDINNKEQNLDQRLAQIFGKKSNLTNNFLTTITTPPKEISDALKISQSDTKLFDDENFRVEQQANGDEEIKVKRQELVIFFFNKLFYFLFNIL